MAGKHIIALLVVAAALRSFAAAKDYVVGDDSGWTLGVDYTAWAKDKNFVVGDTLVFNYKQGAHNIMKVNTQGFESCRAPADGKVLESGNDMITLNSTGNKFYICAMPTHCEAGQKLMIMVSSMQAAAPASPPTPGSSTRVAAGSFMAMVVSVISLMGVL